MFTLDTRAYHDLARAQGAAGAADAAGDGHHGAVASAMGKTMLQGVREYAAEHDLKIEGIAKAAIPDDQVVNVLRGFLANWFPLLAANDHAGESRRGVGVSVVVMVHPSAARLRRRAGLRREG